MRRQESFFFKKKKTEIQKLLCVRNTRRNEKKFSYLVKKVTDGKDSLPRSGEG